MESIVSMMTQDYPMQTMAIGGLLFTLSTGLYVRSLGNEEPSPEERRGDTRVMLEKAAAVMSADKMAYLEKQMEHANTTVSTLNPITHKDVKPVNVRAQDTSVAPSWMKEAKIAYIEKQINEATSESRKATLVTMLNELKSGSPYSVPTRARPLSAPVDHARSPAASHSAPVVDKDLAAKIASLEWQIKDANSEARKAPLVSQLNTLRFGSPYPPTRSSSNLSMANYTPLHEDEKAAKIASLEKQIRATLRDWAENELLEGSVPLP